MILPGEVVETCVLCNVADAEHDRRCPLWLDPNLPRYAVIDVDEGNGRTSSPIVEQVNGGWQSGAHHYPPSVVVNVYPLRLVRDEEVGHGR